jgi:hypothetical protein
MRVLISTLKWMAITAAGLLSLIIMLGIGGYGIPEWLFPETDVSREKPYADHVGRDYRVKRDVTALAWNDFPDKAKILVVSLMPSPGARNRFVSYSIPLRPGQRIRIISAWRRFALVGFDSHYLVSVPGAGLPDGIPVKIRVDSDGVPDPLVYEVIDKQTNEAQR